MRILAFDTATAACSAALWEDGAVTAHCFEAMAKGHSERLMPMLSDVMEEAGRAYQDLDLIAVTTGPGGFTGVRIGLAAARGLALARGLPCLGVTTFDAVAAGVAESERRDRAVLIAIETKRADVYAQAFDARLTAVGGPAAAAPGDLAGFLAANGVTGRLVVAGDAAGRCLDALGRAGLDAAPSAAPPHPDAALVAAVAARRWDPDSGDPRPPAPLYLQPPQAVVPKDGGRLRR